MINDSRNAAQRPALPAGGRGVDSVWEQKKLEARKMLENAAESHTSGARFVSHRYLEETYTELCASAIADEMISSFTPFFLNLSIKTETSTLPSRRSRSARNP